MKLFIYGEPASVTSDIDVSKADWENATNRRLVTLDDDEEPDFELFLRLLSDEHSHDEIDYVIGQNHTGLWYVLRRRLEQTIVAGLFSMDITPIPPVFVLDSEFIPIYT